jgi:hypothetical protein
MNIFILIFDLRLCDESAYVPTSKEFCALIIGKRVWKEYFIAAFSTKSLKTVGRVVKRNDSR